MNIIGLGGWDHDANAALINSQDVLAIGEEERFSRTKHQGHQYSHALKHCIQQSQFIPIEHVAIGFLEKSIAQHIIEAARAVPQLAKASFHPIAHHHSHAANAFYPSAFDEALVLTIDGFGDDLCSTAAFMKGTTTESIWEIPYPHSLGGLWMSTNFLLGFGMRDAGKVMGLASYGEPRYLELLFDAIKLHPDGSYEFDLAKYRPENFLHSDFSLFKRVVERCRDVVDPLTQVHMDVAASLQSATETIVMHALRAMYGKRPCSNLCLSGGVALNSSLNGHIVANAPFKQVFVPPNPGDSGTGMGSALHLAALTDKQVRGPMLVSPYLGAEFTQDQIHAALREAGIGYSHPTSIEKDVAQLLAQGKIVGWFQGRAEAGPRALGNRSILADPRRPDMKNLLNGRVKFREWFRPFAPSIIAEKRTEWFDTDTESPYMSFVFPVRPVRRAEIPAVTHVDGTARLQTVRYEQNPAFYNLIEEFQALSGVPLLLNTSFNIMGEPIVNSPRDALTCFLKSGIDVLAMGNTLIKK